VRVTKYPLLIILLSIGVTIFFGVQLPKLVLSNNVDDFIPDNNPEVYTPLPCHRLYNREGGS